MSKEARNKIIQRVFLGIATCTAIANSNLSKAVHVEVGFHQYAERVDPTTILKMPFNAIINLGYVAVGIYWLKNIQCFLPSHEAAYYFDMFSIMSIAYGPVQFLRVITQHRLFAVLDQWFTLPIFAWASLIGNYALHQQHKPAAEACVLLMSVASYGLAFVSPYGFEAALSMHIAVAVTIGIICQLKSGTKNSFKYLMYAILCCFGFVLLKVYDHDLGRQHWIFKTISGHFLSKICDILQIHFVEEFFLTILAAEKFK